MHRLMKALRERDDERGFALPAVLGIAMVVMLLVITMVTTSTSGARVTAKDTAWQRAAAAAQAGIADYQARLNANNGYGTYGDKDAAFSAATGSTFSSGKDTANPAFASAAGAKWVTVPGADGTASDESYTYAVDNSKLGAQGLIRLQVTGKSGTTTRTYTANIRPDGFSNYLYFTNFESGDPSITNETYRSGTKYYSCTSDLQPDRSSSSCQKIQFGPNDELEGPVRTNDQLLVCGSTFDSTVQSVYGYSTDGCSSTQKATFATTPTTTSTLTPPSTIGNLRDYARTDLTSTTDTNEGVGCLYTGPTKVTFNGNGTMTVVSPLTVVTEIKGATATSGATITSGDNNNSAKCGTVADLHGNGATVPIPTNNILYVQNEPAQRSGSVQDPNYWAASAYKNQKTACDATSTASTQTTLKSNGVGFPYVYSGNYSQYSSYQRAYSEANPTAGGGAAVTDPYGCSNGDIFVQGTVDKAVTLAAENYVYVTGDLVYPTNRTASTVVGIIGQEAVWVWNPINSTGSTLLGSGREIDASILSNQGTFVVQNWTQGSTRGMGTLTVNGSIAQNWRGAVGLASGTGYVKDYKYDSSLRTYTPPKFPQPTVTTYTVAAQVESKTAYSSTGAPQ
jgi:Tfp pilus assembly protein PilX